MDTGSCNEAIFMLTLPQMEINIWDGFLLLKLTGERCIGRVWHIMDALTGEYESNIMVSLQVG